LFHIFRWSGCANLKTGEIITKKQEILTYRFENGSFTNSRIHRSQTNERNEVDWLQIGLTAQPKQSTQIRILKIAST
jgi:hypothetical protein